MIRNDLYDSNLGAFCTLIDLFHGAAINLDIVLVLVKGEMI